MVAPVPQTPTGSADGRTRPVPPIPDVHKDRTGAAERVEKTSRFERSSSRRVYAQTWTREGTVGRPGRVGEGVGADRTVDGGSGRGRSVGCWPSWGVPCGYGPGPWTRCAGRHEGRLRHAQSRRTSYTRPPCSTLSDPPGSRVQCPQERRQDYKKIRICLNINYMQSITVTLSVEPLIDILNKINIHK